MVRPTELRHFCYSCGLHPPPHRMRDDLKGQACAHPSRTCTLCWQAWIDGQYEYAPPNRFTCVQCENVLTQADIRTLGTPGQYERYLDMGLKMALSAREDFRWCMSPTCDSGQFHECGNIFECIECGHKHCVPCQLPCHPGSTCEEAQQKHEASTRTMEKAFLDGPQLSDDEDDYDSDGEPADLNTKKCPGCSRKVQKRSGCEHMICTMCGYEFCWLCLADFASIRRKGARYHQKGCRMYHNARDRPLRDGDGHEGAESPGLTAPNVNVDGVDEDAAANAGEDGGVVDEVSSLNELHRMLEGTGSGSW